MIKLLRTLLTGLKTREPLENFFTIANSLLIIGSISLLGLMLLGLAHSPLAPIIILSFAAHSQMAAGTIVLACLVAPIALSIFAYLDWSRIYLAGQEVKIATSKDKGLAAPTSRAVSDAKIQNQTSLPAYSGLSATPPDEAALTVGGSQTFHVK